MFRSYRILLDGEEVGRLKEGRELRLEIEEGHHVIRAKIDWCGSHPLSFEAGSDDITVNVRSGVRGWRVILAVIYAIACWREWVVLELAE